MIEFNGRLTGAAEKRFFDRARASGQNVLLISLLFLSPPITVFSIMRGYWGIIIGLLAVAVAILLLARIPQSQKDKEKMIPRKIFTEDEYIICIANAYTESRLIRDAKMVRDFGEFYEVVFPMGKVSEKFICQKDLLTKGSLEEFETLFKDILVVVNKEK